MTICIVTDNFPPHTGGIAHFYKYLVSLLACQGHTVIVLTVDSTSTENDTTEFIDGCTKVTLKRSYQELYSYYKAYFRPGGHDAPYWLSAGFAMRKWLLHHAAKFSIDIIEVSDYGGLGAFLTGNNLPPYVITAHSALHQLLPFGHNALTDHIRVIKQLEMLAFSGCSDVIVHSPLNQQSIQNVFLKDAVFSTAPWQPPNIISQQEKNELPLIIGGFQTVKGSLFIAEVLSYCTQKNIPMQIKWIGYDTYTAPGTSLMSAYIAERFSAIWQTRLQWEGRKSHQDTMQELSASPFLIIPSIWETFNYTALEAAALGKAIIITKQTGASYIFTHHHDAWLVEAGNVEEMANAMVQLSRDKALCERLAVNAQKTVRANFNPVVAYQERMKIYESIKEKPLGVEFAEQMSFLKKYTTPWRKGHYAARAFLKKLINSKPKN